MLAEKKSRSHRNRLTQTINRQNVNDSLNTLDGEVSQRGLVQFRDHTANDLQAYFFFVTDLIGLRNNIPGPEIGWLTASSTH